MWFRIPVLVLPPLPQDPNENLAEWFAIAEETFAELRHVLENSHLKRLRRLEEMPKKASQILWWPFTQHDLVPEESITLIDSCLGDNFSVYKVKLMRLVYCLPNFMSFYLGCIKWMLETMGMLNLYQMLSSYWYIRFMSCSRGGKSSGYIVLSESMNKDLCYWKIYDP